MFNKVVFLIIVFITIINSSYINSKTIIRKFGFKGMEIYKFKKNSSNLRIYDINKDGRSDIIFINNNLSRIEVLIRKKNYFVKKNNMLINKSFVNKGFVLNYWTKEMQISDINGDNRPDIITINNQSGLEIYIQKRNGSFNEARTVAVKETANLKNFEIADLNSDKNRDIILCSSKNAEILWNNGKGLFKKRKKIIFPNGSCHGVIVGDLNGDSKKDLLFYFPKDKLPIRIKMGKKNGVFGWEQAFPLPGVKSIGAIKNSKSSKDNIAVILQNGLIVRMYNLEKKYHKNFINQEEIYTSRLSLKDTGNNKNKSWIIDDFNDDKNSDICISAPDLSQIHMYYGNKNRFSPEPKTINSLRSVKTIGITKNRNIIVFSSVEKSIAIHKKKSLSLFPEIIKSKGKPIAISANRTKYIYSLFKDKGYKIRLFDEDSGKLVKSYKINLSNTPSAMKVIRLEKNKLGIILFLPYEKPVMYILEKDKIKTIDENHFKALSLNIKYDDIIELKNNGTTKLLVLEGKIARIYKWEKNKFIITNQLNTKNVNPSLKAGCNYSDNKKSIILFDENNNSLSYFSNTNNYIAENIFIRDSLTSLKGIGQITLNGKNGLLFIGQSELQMILEKDYRFRFKIYSEYSSKVDQPSLWRFFPVKIGSPLTWKIAAVDSSNRSIEILGMHNKKLVDYMVFEVFQDPGLYNRRKKFSFEPREVASGDINGDKIIDMAVLVHDKLIIYIGE